MSKRQNSVTPIRFSTKYFTFERLKDSLKIRRFLPDRGTFLTLKFSKLYGVSRAAIYK